MTELKKDSNWIEGEFSRLALQLSRRLDRGGKIHTDEMERLKMLTKLQLAKKEKS
tara:strand:+ start:2760 stop:2924 length:165 start_codon:yes stop_codon:yes gene_type:complete